MASRRAWIRAFLHNWKALRLYLQGGLTDDDLMKRWDKGRAMIGRDPVWEEDRDGS